MSRSTGGYSVRQSRRVCTPSRQLPDILRTKEVPVSTEAIADAIEHAGDKAYIVPVDSGTRVDSTEAGR